ncbi:MAG TPA: hypothetical protein IAA60_07080 [Candidatus Ornithomonoglobus intestinigallinarum]|uniref:GLUG domain-containing protein n=1 Tax=Candidatus Ornithomonoglobus intestinigallinarum TaxID=2840894 RepID=A0A9D1KQ96_9FIRM|nr:hypothetical protein [Candidatus Ornithomonoglobus intestinigallinarum]
MLKKVLSAAVAAAMALSVMPMAMAEETGYVTGNVTISNAEEFEVFAAAVNGGSDYSGQTVVLANDIDYNNGELTPVGTRGDSFAGNFNGNGFTIKNASVRDDADAGIINVGVFGFVRGGSVTNVNFSNIDVLNEQAVSPSGLAGLLGDAEESATGVAVGTLKSGTVSYITVDDMCSVQGKLRTGGVVGDTCEDAGGSVVSHCVNYATVTGTQNYTGGIIGAMHNLSRITASEDGSTVEYCDNYGDVTGTTEVGGIVGYADRANISYCHNHEDAEINGSGNYGTGGILGCDIYNPRFLYYPEFGSTITECTNAGTITSPRAGGILGSFVVSPGQSQPSDDIISTIDTCTNTGNIVSDTGKSGGIFGYQIAYASGDGEGSVNNLVVRMIHCNNQGKLNGEPSDILTTSPYVEEVTN